MHLIYFEDKIVSFAATPHPECDLLIMLGSDEVYSPAKIVENLQNNKHLCLKAQDAKKAFNDFCRQFKQTEAAGGVVSNNHGQTLMILRKGKWDLPKGHLEPGEDPDLCAQREVAEETGLTSIFLGEPFTDTLHFYNLNNVWEMKLTHWYFMSSEQKDLTPQTEEGITEAIWCSPAKVRENSQNTYSSILEVLRRAGKLA